MTAVLPPVTTAASRSLIAPERPAGPRGPAAGRVLVRAIGPALLVSAGYVDPGNWGTDVAAGAQYGYRLIWVLAAAMLAAQFLQHLAARLGLACGQDLASLIHTQLPGYARRSLTAPLLAALAVTEIVEILGIVLGVQLLTGWDTGPSAATAVVLVVLVLCAPSVIGRRLVYGCLALIGATYVVALGLHGAGPLVAGLRPSSLPPGGLPVAVGLIGSVIMPHNILLHTALARDLSRTDVDRASTPRLLRGSLLASGIALGLAFVVNVAITSLSAGAGAAPVGAGAMGIHTLVHGLHPAYGQFAATLFAFTLLASGLASSTTGGMVSVDVLTRLAPGLKMPAALRRILLLVPATGLAAAPVPQITLLVWSQVVLTCALPLVLLPLLWFTSRARLMGSQVTSRRTQVVAALITAALLAAGLSSLTSL